MRGRVVVLSALGGDRPREREWRVDRESKRRVKRTRMMGMGGCWVVYGFGC